VEINLKSSKTFTASPYCFSTATITRSNGAS